MKNSNFYGFFDVFKFTYKQSIKSKAIIILTALLFILALLSFPVISLISGEDTIEKSNIECIYFYDDGVDVYAPSKELLNEDSNFSDVKVELVDKEKADNIKENGFENEAAHTVLVYVWSDLDQASEDFGINFDIYFNSDVEEDKDEADNLSEFFYANGTSINYISNGVEKNIAKLLSQSLAYNTYGLDENGEIISDGITEAQYSVNYILIMVTLISITFAGSKVAEQIITEKSSKVVEYILTSVKPMAIITGKVMAAVAIVLTILSAVCVAFVASGFINGFITSTDGSFVLPTQITNFFDKDVMVGANIFSVLISLVVIIEGFVFYGFLGGITGASVSKIEEMAEGSKLYTFALLIGAYLALGLIMSSSMSGDGWGNLNYVVYLLPLSAPFIVPAYMLFGMISPLFGLVIVVVFLICIILLIGFVSNIYEQMIYHNGTPLKMKDLFRLAKMKRRNK